MLARMVLFLLCAFASSFSQLSFTTPPSMTGGGGNWVITFAVSAATDVEVSIVDVRDSSVIRHLAAGMLGATPPAPLQANSLSQSLTWDGKDDFGVLAARPESLSVRVRAGMSPRLANLAGEDLYSFQGNARSTPSLLLDKDGSVLILGKAAGNSFLRKYDASGNYVRTLYPPAAGLPADSVTAYGINVLPGGGWAPKTASTMGPTITGSILNNPATRMLALTDDGEIVLVVGLDMGAISKSGAFTDTASRKIITAPPKPATPYPYGGPFGPQYFTASYNPRYLFLSGWFYGMTSSSGSGWLDWADTSGFWADGQVFLVDRATGVATSWLKLDSVPSLVAERTAKIGWGTNAIAAVHGVALDDSFHVFVCDRLHRRVSVYDTNAVLLGSIPCVNPDFVSISKRTGVVYVLTRGPGLFRLTKFQGWRNAPAPAATITLTTSVDGYTGAPVMAVTENGNTTGIYIGYGSIGFGLYSDNGAGFTLVRDFSENKNSSLVFERVAVDRATDKVFWMRPSYGTGGVKIFAIADWSRAAAYPVYTSATAPLNIDNITVGPKGHIFGLGFETFDTPITRYTADSLPRPAPYANTGSNVASCALHYEGMNHRGVAAGWQGQLAAYEEGYHLWKFPDTGNTSQGTALVTVNSSNLSDRRLLSGVKFDPAGNFYIGAKIRGSDAVVTPGFASDYFFANLSGSVVKFAAGATGAINVSPAVSVTGAAKIYPQPLGPFSGFDNSSACNCRNSYFDVDPYGRLFIPNGSTSQIAVADNAGNAILTFGQYGNTDSRGGLSGPGSPSAEPAFPMAWPTSVAASEDYIYVADAVNARLVRVQMEYALDNIPGLTDNNSDLEAAGKGKGLCLASSPNPFNPESRVTFRLPGRMQVSLSVYDPGGRLVRTLATGSLKAGVHCRVWNAVDNRGRAVSAGVYVYRLTAGDRVLINKTVLSK